MESITDKFWFVVGEKIEYLKLCLEFLQTVPPEYYIDLDGHYFLAELGVSKGILISVEDELYDVDPEKYREFIRELESDLRHVNPNYQNYSSRCCE